MKYSKFKVFKAKDQGGRDSQQDDYYSEYNEALDKLIMVVADGMGGHKGGQIASEIVVKKTKQFFQDKSYASLSAHEFFEKLIPSIHKSIVKRGLKENISPHTTIVIAIVQNGYIEYAHIGDSRLYIFTEEDQLLERTRDHSVPEMLFQMGEISENEMATHPDQNKLTKSLGGERVESFTFKRHKIDRSKNYAIVLCSDGLWEYFTDAQMYKALFKMNLTLDSIGHKMIARAKNIGDKNGDNITLIIAKIPASRKATSNPFSILSKVQLAIVGVILVLLTFGFYYIYTKKENSQLVKEEKIIKKENNAAIKKEESKDNNLSEEDKSKTSKKQQKEKANNSNREEDILKREPIPKRTKKKILSMITDLQKDLDNTKNMKKKDELYNVFFIKHNKEFSKVIKKTNDSILIQNYEDSLNKAKDKYKKKDYNTSISSFYNALNVIQNLIEKDNE